MVNKQEVEIADGQPVPREQRGSVELVRSSMSALAILHSLRKSNSARHLTAITCLTNRLRLNELVEPMVSLHCPTRHGDVVFQVISSFVAQSVDLSVWQDVQGLGILYLSVIAGEMNLKVCELTNAPGTPWASIFGMWQATH